MLSGKVNPHTLEFLKEICMRGRADQWKERAWWQMASLRSSSNCYKQGLAPALPSLLKQPRRVGHQIDCPVRIDGRTMSDVRKDVLRPDVGARSLGEQPCQLLRSESGRVQAAAY